MHPSSPAVASHDPAAADPRAHRQVLLVFVGLMLAMLLSALDQTVVATALPTITGDLHGLNLLSWVVTGYLLAETVAMPLYGKLGDLFGRKPVFQFAIVLFLVGSALCGLSQNMGELIIFRTIQGLGAGGLMISAQAIIGEVVSARDRGKYMSILVPMFGIASVIGPLIGGFLTDQASWRWIFYVNLPVGAAALALISVVLRPSASKRKPRIDYLGTGLLAGAVTSLVLLTSWGGTTYAWSSAVIVGLGAATVALIALWLLAERHAAEPVLPLRLFRDGIFDVSVVLGFAVGLAMFGAVTYLPTFLQLVDGASATSSGLLLLPLVAGMLTTSVVTGQLLSRTGRYKVFPILGTGIGALGLFLLSRLTAGTSTLESSAYMAVLGLGLGLIMPVLTLVVQNSVSYEDLGVATSGVSFFRQIGGSMGVALAGALFTSRLQRELAIQLPPNLAQQAAGHINGITPAAIKLLPPQLQHGLVAAFAHALPPVFLYFVPILLGAFVLAWFLKEKPLATHAHAAAPASAEADADRRTEVEPGAAQPQRQPRPVALRELTAEEPPLRRQAGDAA